MILETDSLMLKQALEPNSHRLAEAAGSQFEAVGGGVLAGRRFGPVDEGQVVGLENKE